MAPRFIIPLFDERLAQDLLCIGAWQQVTQGFGQRGLLRALVDGWRLVGATAAASGKQHSGHRYRKQTIWMHHAGINDDEASKRSSGLRSALPFLT